MVSRPGLLTMLFLVAELAHLAVVAAAERALVTKMEGTRGAGPVHVQRAANTEALWDTSYLRPDSHRWSRLRAQADPHVAHGSAKVGRTHRGMLIVVTEMGLERGGAGDQTPGSVVLTVAGLEVYVNLPGERRDPPLK
eukprot:CAMPEP_0204328602 /NCGR_PEP_ID=MMETSP0469-20131031/13494_1 /ASSEMBLY_ACC=CAM_ASM_000384 /TAXON_ID=2969 /ORGANISM="Oxyrrhis marina" /LENGTH=137 /DNA_ID=CAMNT_0051311029 /DNA_START=243 /DNA_END=657 /DNA_ORIENTATION=-